VLAAQVARREAVEVVAQGRHLDTQPVELGERDDAHFAVLERHRLHRVMAVADPVDAEYFAGHVIAGDLLAPVLGEDHRLERA
jgi:hypothetical protein